MNISDAICADGAANLLLSGAILGCYLAIVGILALRSVWLPVFCLSVAANIPHVVMFLTGADPWPWYPSVVCAFQIAAVFESAMKVSWLISNQEERSQSRQGAFVLGVMFVCAYGASGPNPYPASGAMLRTITDFAAAGILFGALGYAWRARTQSYSPFMAHGVVLFTYFLAGVFADGFTDPKDWFATNAILSIARLGCAVLWIRMFADLPVSSGAWKTYRSRPKRPASRRGILAEDR